MAYRPDRKRRRRTSSRSHSRGRPAHRQGFREILAEVKNASIERAWNRARLASQLRRSATQAANHPGARALSDVKVRAIERVLELGGDEVRVGIDGDHHVGLVSVRLVGKGRLHLPACYREPTMRWEPQVVLEGPSGKRFDRPRTPWALDAKTG